MRSLTDLVADYLDSSDAGAETKRKPGKSAGRKWAQFSAAGAAALSATSIADAAIVHVVPPSPITVDVDNNQAVGIDVDGDFQFDLQLGAGRYPIGTTFQPAFSQLGTLRGYGGALVASGGVFGQYPNTAFAVEKYSPGAVISPFNAGGGSYIRISQTGFTYNFQGKWGRSETAYAGFALDFGQPTAQAGWVKVRTRRSGSRLDKVDVLEWAYETTPNTAIQAGATSSADPVDGDYDGNGTVGPEDYAEWKSALGETANPAGSGADGNADGTVNAADYAVWLGNLGASNNGAVSSAEIPEPQAVTLGVLALGAAGVAALRRRVN